MKKTLLSLFLILVSIHISAAQSFTSIWDTDQPGTSGNTEITIPTNTAFTYNYTVDWGDGNTDTGVTGDITHDYGTTGNYTVAISGTFPAIYFNNGGDRRKIIEITSWGNITWQSMENAYYGCENLNFDAIAAPDLSQVTSLKNMFRSALLFNGILNGWNVSTITDISGMFMDARIFNRPLDGWATGAVTDMSDTFNTARDFNEPLDNWQTGAVTNMARMFRSANDFNQNINNWNVSQVTDMEAMFSATDMVFPLNNWNVLQVTTMREMFRSTPFNEPLSDWDVDNVTDMHEMFRDTPFNQDISSWDVGNVTDMSGMFERNYAYNQPLNDWNVTNVINMADMFAGIFGSVTPFNQPIDTWNVSNVTNMDGMFRSSRFNQPIEGWNVSNVTDMGDMFEYNPDFNQPLEGWDISNVTDIVAMFRITGSFNQPLNGWDITNITNLTSVFSQATEFNQPLDMWNTINVTNMTRTFDRATVFDQNIGDWNITAVTNMTDMLNDSGISETNYDSILMGWDAQMVNDDITLGAKSLLYCDGRFARQNLIDDHNWTIVDDIIDCSFVICTDIISPVDGDINVPANFSLVWEAAPGATGYRLTVDKDTGGVITAVLNDVNVGNVTFYDFPVNFAPGDIVTATVVPFNAEGPAVGCITETYTIIDSWVNSPAAFKLTYDTTITYSGSSAANQLKVSRNTSYAYNYSIDWGDDQFDNNVTGDITHTYETPGIYTISIIGDYPAHFFNFSNTDNRKLLTIDQWGSQQWQSMRQSFLDCRNMTYNATDVPDLSQVTSMNNMFNSCHLFDGNINNWNVSNVTDFSSLFLAAFAYNQPMDQWVVDNATNMSGMFLIATSFNQPIENWNVANVTNMARMFDGFTQDMAFNQPLNEWDIDNVTTMFAMFRRANNFNQPLNMWNVANVTDMESMFERTVAFNQNIENWTVDNVTNMESMFEGATGFNSPINGWNVANVTNMEATFRNTVAFNQPLNLWTLSSCFTMGSMFQGAIAFNQPLDSWNVATVTNMASMFENTTLFNQDIASWNVSQVTNMRSMFEDAITFDQPLAMWDVNSVVNMISMFENAQVFNQPIGGWNVSAVADMTSMFENAQLFNQPIDAWDVSSVTQMESMFEEAQVFNQVINSWDVTSVTNMEAMFKNAAIYNQPLGNWETNELLTTAEMFEGATSFNQNIDTWNTSFVRTMEAMFESATAFNQPINSWNVASVTTMENMFKNAISFNQTINDWNTRAVLTMEEMFHGAVAFNQPLDNWRVFNVSDMEEMFRNATAFNQDLNAWDLEIVDLNSMFRDASAYNQYLGDWNMTQVTNVSNMLDNTAIIRMNYDNTLIAWSEQALPSGLSLGANTLPYCDALEERQAMITNYGWSFNGDVLDCPIPVCTQLISPMDGDIDVPVNTNLTWEPALFARGYRLTVTVDPGTVIVNNLSIIDETSYNFAADFNPGDVVRVTIIPFNDTGDATGCTEEMFTIAADPATIPDCTSLTMPINGATDVAIDTDIAWSPIPNADGYFLSIGTTPGGIDIVNNENVGNVTTYDFPANLPETSIIYVTITPFNDLGNATGCAEESFMTETIPVAPGCTTLSDPLNGAMDVPLDTNITWNAVPNATGYLVTIGITSGGIEVANSIDVGNMLTYDFPADLQQDRVHYVTITPYNDVGDAMGCSEENFKTELPSSVDAMCMDITVNLDATGSVTIQPNDIDNGSSSTNGTVTLSISMDTFTCENVGPNTVTLIVTDDTTGETTSCTATVTVEDPIAPMITCPGDQTAAVATNCQFILPDYTGLAIIDDNCGNISSTQTPASGTTVGIGTTMITITANDGTNMTSCTFELEVTDATPPLVNCVAPFSVQLDATGMAFITAADIDNGSTDNCGIANTTIDITEFTCDTIGENTVTLTVTDIHGNVATCATIVTVEDPLFACNEVPVANCQPVIVSANENCQGIAIASDFDNGSFDPDGEMVTFTVVPEGPYPLGTTTVTLIVNDGELTNSCETTITVNDTTPPSISCPGNTIANTNENCEFIIPDYTGLGTATDNCSIVSVMQFPPVGTIVPIGNYTITLTADDGISQVDCTFMLEVMDNTPPVASCQDITIPLDDMGMANISAADISNMNTDACGIASIELDIDSFDCSNVGPNTVTLTVTDTNGNMSTCTAIVTIEDIVAPIAVCQNITVALDSSGTATIVPEDINNGSSDNCEIASLALDIDTFDCSNLGTNTVTLTVTDVNGNIGNCMAIVTIEETEAPIAFCQDITVALNAMGTITITAAAIDGGSTDNCAITSSSIDISAFTCEDIGANTVTLTIQDANGNSDSCTAIVTVVDETPPTVVCQNITIELEGDGTALITASEIDGGSTDNCEIETISIDTSMFDCSNLGENTVTLTVTDTAGNQASCEAIVTVTGTNGVQAECQNITIPLGQDGTAMITPLSIYGGSIDISCPENVLSIDIDTFTCEDIGAPIIVTLSAIDNNGTVTTCQAFVNVVDTLGPEVTCPADQTITSEGPYILPDYFATGEAMANDNCTDPVTVFDQDPSPGTLMPQGTYTIELSAFDANGFEGTCEFTLIVDDLLGTSEILDTLDTVYVYPNPFSNQITIENPKLLSIDTIQLYDVTGRLVKALNISETIEKQIIDLSELASASYFLRIETERLTKIVQLIKE